MPWYHNERSKIFNFTALKCHLEIISLVLKPSNKSYIYIYIYIGKKKSKGNTKK
jgi:hypothetical protein